MEPAAASGKGRDRGKMLGVLRFKSADAVCFATSGDERKCLGRFRLKLGKGAKQRDEVRQVYSKTERPEINSIVKNHDPSYRTLKEFAALSLSVPFTSNEKRALASVWPASCCPLLSPPLNSSWTTRTAALQVCQPMHSLTDPLPLCRRSR